MIAPSSGLATGERRTVWLGLALVATIAATPRHAARAQDTTASGTRSYLLEFRIGETSAVGGRTTTLVGNDAAAVGLSFAFEATTQSWGWVSFDFRPLSSAVPANLGVGTAPPAVGMYSITGGVSRKFGRPIGRGRWRPLELGVGVGATRVEFEAYGSGQPGALPPDAQLEYPFAPGVMSSVRWRPAASARLHVALPLGSAFRIGGGVSLIAAHVGDARMWDGGWEPTGVGSRYRPTTRLWSFGTVFTAPVTVSLGLRL